MEGNNCITQQLRDYIAWHLEADAQQHVNMTTEAYRISHPHKWDGTLWERWVKDQKKEASESRQAVDFIKGIPVCTNGD